MSCRGYWQLNDTYFEEKERLDADRLICRPVSLLNTDQNILAKSLARTFSPLMAKLVHPDQTRFIPNGHLIHNFRCFFNIMYFPRNPKEDMLILSLDTEKHFDCVEWPYLFAVLEKMYSSHGVKIPKKS